MWIQAKRWIIKFGHGQKKEEPKSCLNAKFFARSVIEKRRTKTTIMDKSTAHIIRINDIVAGALHAKKLRQKIEEGGSEIDNFGV